MVIDVIAVIDVIVVIARCYSGYSVIVDIGL